VRSKDTARVLYLLTDADAFSEYEVYCVCRALLTEAKGADNEGAAIQRMAREIVADWDDECPACAGTGALEYTRVGLMADASPRTRMGACDKCDGTGRRSA